MTGRNTNHYTIADVDRQQKSRICSNGGLSEDRPGAGVMFCRAQPKPRGRLCFCGRHSTVSQARALLSTMAAISISKTLVTVIPRGQLAMRAQWEAPAGCPRAHIRETPQETAPAGFPSALLGEIPQRAVLGIEPRTSRTLSENHATRPNSHVSHARPHRFRQSSQTRIADASMRTPSRYRCEGGNLRRRRHGHARPYPQKPHFPDRRHSATCPETW